VDVDVVEQPVQGVLDQELPQLDNGLEDVEERAQKDGGFVS
jgi:hypothetical protein